MNNFKMICLDIDGTLLNSQNVITDKTKKAIVEAVYVKNVVVILVSARMPKGITFLQNELSIEYPIVCYSGALITDSKSNVILNKTIGINDAERICSAAEYADISISLYKDDEWYIKKTDPWSSQECDITNIVPNVVDFDTLLGVWSQKHTGPNKILCMGKPDSINSLKSTLKDLNLGLNIYLSKPTYLEIMPEDASKTSAIEVLCKKYNIQKSDVIAVGDNYNDVDMIKYAGLGIAMGNAPYDVKRCADDVTLSNDDDGVAEVIKKYIL